MKMSPTGLPGLLVVLFVVFTTCAFFGVQFLWVLLGLGALGVGLAAVLSEQLPDCASNTAAPDRCWQTDMQAGRVG